MIVGNLKDLDSNKIQSPLAQGASIKVLVGAQEGWKDHVMRVLTLEPGGHSPKHQHDWPHINYIISGKGTLFLDGKLHELSAGSYAYVPANELHQFANAGDEPFQFMCIVPDYGHQ